MTQDQTPNGSNGQTQALTPYQQRAIELREDIGTESGPRAIVPKNFAEAQSFAAAIANSSLVPQALAARAPDVLMIILAGAELEIPPVRALSLFHVIEGVPKLSADGVAARVVSSPMIEYLEPIEQSDERVTWRGKRRGRPEVVLTWTIAQANNAGLVRPNRNGSPGNWQKFPRQMLNARCKKEVANLIAPDLVAGLTTAEEAYDMLLDAPASSTPSGSFTAPPPPPSAPSPAAATTKATEGKGSRSTASKPPAASKPPIDVPATESTSASTSSSAPSANTNAATTAPSPNTSPASTTAASTTSSDSSRPSDTAPDVTASSSPATASGPSVPAEDSSGFGDEEAPANDARTIERFESELAACVSSKDAARLNAIKADWIPWSKEEGPNGGKQYAQRMRASFAKASADLGAK